MIKAAIGGMFMGIGGYLIFIGACVLVAPFIK